MQSSAAGLRADVFKVKAGRVKDQVTLHSAEPGGEIRNAGGSVFDVHMPGDARMVQSSFKRRVDLSHAARVEIRNITAQKAKIQSAIQLQSKSAAPSKLHGPGNLKIRILALKGNRFNLEGVARGTKMNHAGVLQLDIGVIHGHAREICIHSDAFRAAKRAIDRDIAIGIGMASEILEVKSGEQEGIQINVLDGDLSVQIVRFSQGECIAAGDFSGGHGGRQFKMRGGAI